MKQENPSPGKENDNAKNEKTETPKKSPKKSPSKIAPAKKKTPKSEEKSKSKSKKSSPPAKSPSKVKAEVQSPVKVKEEKVDEKMDASTSPSQVKEEKPKPHPFFTKQKDIKLQMAEDSSDGASYNPGKANYHPIKDCFWEHGGKYVNHL